MCGGILYLMEHIKIKHIIITKQYENSENYRKFLSIAKTKKIKIYHTLKYLIKNLEMI